MAFGCAAAACLRLNRRLLFSMAFFIAPPGLACCLEKPPMSHASGLRLCHFGMEGRSLHAFEIFLSRITSIDFQITTEDIADVGFIDLDHPAGNGLLESQRQRFPGRPLILATQKSLNFDDPLLVLVNKPIGLGAFTLALQQARDLLPERQTNMAVEPATVCQVTEAPAETRPATPEPAPETAIAATPATVPADPAMPVGQDPLAVLRQQEERMAAFYVGTKPDIDLDDPAARLAIFYEPANFLQGMISRARTHAREIGRPVKVVDGQGTVLYLSPDDNHAHQVCSNNSLRALAQLPTQPSVQMSQVEPHEQGSMEDFPLRPLMSLEWDATLWASRGRLPLGTDLDAPVRMHAWPDLTRLVIPPEAMRIAGLWSRKPITLRQTLEQLQIPQRYVFAFYSACHALGLVSQPEVAQQAAVLASPAEPATTAPDPQPAMRGLFRRLLGKLLGTRLGEAETG
jgi:hypothetical protein